MRIGIIIAMDIEYQKMCDALGGKSQGSINGNDVILWQCGIGKVNAAIGAMNLISQHHPDCIISTGLAGGIDDCLHVMDVVVGSQTAYHDVWCGEPNALGQVQDMPLYYDAPDNLVHKVISDQLDYKSGLIVTGDQFLTDKQRLKEIKEAFPKALAVDMESAAVAQVCYLNQIPYLSLRIISDVVGKESQLEQYNNFWQQVPHKASKMLADVLALILK